MTTPQDPDSLLLHQVHGAKLAADAGAALLSMWLFWSGRTKSGFAVHYLIPAAASLLVLRTDVSRLRATNRGRYVLAHMPPGAQAIRAAGDTLMVRGARRHQRKLIAAGAVAVAGGWAAGLLRRNRESVVH